MITIRVLMHDLETGDWDLVEESVYEGEPASLGDHVRARFGPPAMPALVDEDGETVHIGWVFDDQDPDKGRETVVLPILTHDDGEEVPLYLAVRRQRRLFEDLHQRGVLDSVTIVPAGVADGS